MSLMCLWQPDNNLILLNIYGTNTIAAATERESTDSIVRKSWVNMTFKLFYYTKLSFIFNLEQQASLFHLILSAL